MLQQLVTSYELISVKKFPDKSFAVTIHYFENGKIKGNPIIKVGQHKYLSKLLRERYQIYF